MKAIIIAAGSSSRLEKLTESLPKGLLEINGQTIIQRQIEFLRTSGINDIVIVTGPNAHCFDFKDITYVHDHNYEQHDVLGSLMVARNFMYDGFIMLYSDIVFDESVLKSILNFKGKIGIGVDMDWEKKYEKRTEHPAIEADNVLINNGKVLQIKKNMANEMKNEKLGEFIGIMCLSSKGAKNLVRIYERLKKNQEGLFQNAPSLKKAYLTDMLQELIDLNFNVEPIICNGTWCEIDTPQDLEIARKNFCNMFIS